MIFCTLQDIRDLGAIPFQARMQAEVWHKERWYLVLNVWFDDQGATVVFASGREVRKPMTAQICLRVVGDRYSQVDWERST